MNLEQYHFKIPLLLACHWLPVWRYATCKQTLFIIHLLILVLLRPGCFFLYEP